MIGDRGRFGLVGDDHHRAGSEAAQQRQDDRAVLLTEIAGRLVGEDQLGIVDQRARDRQPLLLATGELVGAAPGDLRQAEALDQRTPAPLPAARSARQARRNQHVLLAAQLLDQMKGLEDQADVSETRPRKRPRPLGCQLPAGDHDPTRIRAVEAAEEMKEGRLAAARAPEHGDHLARLHVEVHSREQTPGGASGAHRLGDAPCLQDRHFGYGSECLETSGELMITSLEIELRSVGHSPVVVPRVALGCGSFGGIGSAPEFFGQGMSEDQAFELMDAAWELGITHFDTADAYGGGRSEQAIGRWIRSRGVKPLLTTKTFYPMAEGADHGLAPERIERQLEASLERLGVERVDLYLAHDYDPEVPLADTLAAFDELQRAAKIRAHGVSNFDGPQLSAAVREGHPEAVQNAYSLLERRDQAEVLPLCEGSHLAYLAFSPLSGGWLTGKYRRGESYPEGSRMTQRPEPYHGLEREETFEALDRLRVFAREHGVSLGGLALAWLLADRRVTQIVVGPGRPQHLGPVSEALSAPLSALQHGQVTRLVAP